MNEIYLGEPPQYVKDWINKHISSAEKKAD